MKSIQSIDIVFENCECITFDAKDIGFIVIGDVKPFIKRVACNSILEMKVAEEVAIELFSSRVSASYNPFELINQHKIIQDRLLEYKDITQLVIHYDDGTLTEVYTKWDGSSMENSFQKCMVGGNGNVYLVVSESKDIDDYFPSSMTDDVESANITRTAIGNAHSKV